MSTHSVVRFIHFVALGLALAWTSIQRAQSEEFDHIGIVRLPTAAAWGGSRWTTTETGGFKGRPKMSTDSDTTHFVTVAYGRFVSYYDLRNFSPRWVAYVTDRSSANVSEAKTRTGTEFARPSTFFTEGVIADASSAIGLEPVDHFDYSDRVPQGLTGDDVISKTITAVKARAKPAIIERGHLAPNNTMKCWGTKAKGQVSQSESFSLANVVPQMKGHNAPTWSALEAQCLTWAQELGTVCVIVGPIYDNPTNPRHIQERKTEAPLDIPFADKLFCVVIGMRQGQTAVIAFIMPQMTESYSWKGKAVPVDNIEQATGINFMPLLGEPNPLEQTVDDRWLSGQ
jgi:hypothetical protein